MQQRNITTRVHPRTLNEAFPDTVENATWLYPPEKSVQVGSGVLSLLAIAVCMLVFWLVVHK